MRYFAEIHKLQTELGVFETGVPLILGHGVCTKSKVKVASKSQQESCSFNSWSHFAAKEWFVASGSVFTHLPSSPSTLSNHSLVEKMAAYHQVVIIHHMRADCLQIGISSRCYALVTTFYVHLYLHNTEKERNCTWFQSTHGNNETLLFAFLSHFVLTTICSCCCYENPVRRSKYERTNAPKRWRISICFHSRRVWGLHLFIANTQKWLFIYEYLLHGKFCQRHFNGFASTVLVTKLQKTVPAKI